MTARQARDAMAAGTVVMTPLGALGSIIGWSDDGYAVVKMQAITGGDLFLPSGRTESWEPGVLLVAGAREQSEQPMLGL